MKTTPPFIGFRPRELKLALRAPLTPRPAAEKPLDFWDEEISRRLDQTERVTS